jgi:hypothetical protein
MQPSENTQTQGNEASMMKQFIKGTENPHEVIMVTLVEAVSKHSNANRAMTRRVNKYQAKDTVPATVLNGLNDEMGIKNPSMAAIKDAGFRPVKTIRPNQQPRTYDLGELDATDLVLKPAVRRCLAALVSLKAYQDANRRAVETSGQEAIKIDLTIMDTTPEMLQAFGLMDGDMVRYVPVDSKALIRDGMNTLKQIHDSDNPNIALDTRNRVEGATVHQYALQGDGVDCLKAHLAINTSTVLEWTNNGHAAAWYCSPCQKSWGYQQIKRANACPDCGNGKRNLGMNSVTMHLPVLTKTQGGLKTYGGHRVHFKACRIKKSLFNRIVMAHQGQLTTAQLMADIMATDGGASRFSTRIEGGKWSKMDYDVVPCSFEVQLGGEQVTLLGIALERRFKA